MAKETVTFEHLVAPSGVTDVPAFYDGVSWSGTGVLDKSNSGAQSAGYQAVIHGRATGYIYDVGSFVSSSSFTLISGHFASGYLPSLKVEITALREDIPVGHMKVTLTEIDRVINFNKHFAHIDGVRIEALDGTNPAFDNLKVSFVGPIPSAEHGTAAHAAMAEMLATHDAVHAHGGEPLF